MTDVFRREQPAPVEFTQCAPDRQKNADTVTPAPALPTVSSIDRSALILLAACARHSQACDGGYSIVGGPAATAAVDAILPYLSVSPDATTPAPAVDPLDHPRVVALVDAAKDACQELEQAQLSQIAAKNYALAGMAITAHDNLAAALAALRTGGDT